MGTEALLAGREWLALVVVVVVVAASVATILLVFVRKDRRDRSEARSRSSRSALREALQQQDEADLRTATSGMALGRAGEQTDLLAVLTASRHASWWTEQTTTALRNVLAGHGFVDVLRRQLSSRSAAERGTAVLLGSHPSCQLTTDEIAARMRDRDPTVRLAAAAALERAESDEAADALVDSLGAADLPAARIIERLGHAWAVDVCRARLRALDDQATGTVRASLARALGLAGSPRAIDVLHWLLDVGNPEEVIQAMRALGECVGTASPAQRDEILSAARARITSPDHTLALMATRALAATGTVADIGRLAGLVEHRDWHVRREAATALAAMGPPGVSALRTIANGSDRYAATRAREELQIARLLDDHDIDGPMGLAGERGD